MGLESAKKQLNAILDAHRSGLPLQSMLFYGAAGTGKTTLARAFAADAGIPIHATVGNTLKEPENLWRFCEGMLPDILREGACIAFIDEVHAIARRAEVWLPLLEDRILYHNMAGKTFTWEPRLKILKKSEEAEALARDSLYQLNTDVSHYPGVIWIGATTDPDLCGRAILRRFPTRIMLPNYSVEDITKLVRKAARKLVLDYEALSEGDIKEEVFPIIAERSRLSPGEALNLLQRLVPYATQEPLTRGSVLRVLRDLEVGEKGLRQEDRLALGYLKKVGACGLGSLQQALDTYGVSPRSYRTLVEPFLVREGWVKITNAGREITDEGLRAYERAREAVA